jgi:hypothetical protein
MKEEDELIKTRFAQLILMRKNMKTQKKINDGSHELDWKACWINIHKGRVTSMDEERGKTTNTTLEDLSFVTINLRTSYHKIH